MAEPIVQRLIMIATSSWRWPPDHSTCTRHETMLAALLDEEATGRAWLCCAEPAQRHAGRRADDVTGAAAANGRGEDPDTWYPHTEAVDARQELMDDLRQACFDHLRAPHAMAPTSLRAYRHRVFMDRKRFLEVVGAGPWGVEMDAVPFDVELDFRFSWRHGELTCHVSSSVWSHTPWSRHHRPPDLTQTHPDAGLDRRLYKAVFEAVEQRLVEWVGTGPGFAEQTLRVFDRPYRAPVFWVAVPADAEDTRPLDHLGRLRELDVVGPLLGVDDPQADGVSRSVIGDEALVLRRFAPAGTEDVPRYLLLPGRPSPGLGGERRFTDQEDRLRGMITTLADLELAAAAELWSIQGDLEIWENHLSVYDHVVARGNALWDGLAGHLVQHRGKELDSVHRSIELVHQTMLQGVADADGVATLVDRQRSRIPEVVTELTTTYAQELVETPVPGGPGLCETLTGDGPIVEVTQRAEQIWRTAERVARNYRDLVQGISDAFDERRVRETDVLQRTTFAVGLFVGLVGLVTVADTTVDLHTRPGAAVTWLVLGLVWFGGVLLLGGLTFAFWRWARLGRLGSRRYRRTYRVVWEVLRYCSTDHIRTVEERLEPREAVLPAGELTGLHQLSELVETQRKEQAAQWAAYDERIARRWAHAWDRVSDLPGDVRFAVEKQVPGPTPDRWLLPSQRERRAAARADLEQLTRMVEKWSLRTFLVAERPLEMWKSNLPRLTILYRSAMQLLGRDDFRVVSGMDFWFLLSNHQHGLTWDEVQQLHRWLDREIRQRRGDPMPEGLPGRVSATEFLGAVEELGVHAGMVDTKADVVARLGAPAPVDEEFDPFSARFQADPHGWRPTAPVVYSPRMDRWVVAGSAEVAQVLGDGALFSPVEARRPLTPLCDEAATILNSRQRGGPLTSGDPKDRARYRRHHERLFGTGTVEAAEADLRTAATALVETIRPAGRADLVTALLQPLPVRTVLRTLGLREADATRLAMLARRARRLHGEVLDIDDQVAAAVAMRDLWTECRSAVQNHAPGGPLADAGDLDDRAELVVQAVLSGPAATTALLSNGLLGLLGTERWAQFCAEPDGHEDDLVEECLRNSTPVVLWRREAVKAVTVGGAALPAGARILVHIGAANRDQSLPGGAHLSFGTGAHACPGQDLVRAHARAVFTTLARQLPDLRRARDHEPEFTCEIGLHGLLTLPVEWSPDATPSKGPSQR
jgi:cytochrome P450